MKRKILCLLLCVCMCVGMFAMSGCGSDSESAKEDKKTDNKQPSQKASASGEILDAYADYRISEYTYEIDGVAYSVLQVMKRQYKEPFPSPATKEEVYGNYNVSVRFDANGGHFAGSVSTYSMIDAFHIQEITPNESGTVSLALLNPEDDRRAEPFQAMRQDHLLAGWYTLDADGNKQMWDFETDRVAVDSNGDYTATEPVLTLYALWYPTPSVEYYNVDKPNEPMSVEFCFFGAEIKLPIWNEQTGKMEYYKFPRLGGYSIKTVYYDAAKMHPVTETVIAHPATINEAGEVENRVLKFYIEYVEDK